MFGARSECFAAVLSLLVLLEQLPGAFGSNQLRNILGNLACLLDNLAFLTLANSLEGTTFLDTFVWSDNLPVALNTSSNLLSNRFTLLGDLGAFLSNAFD